MEWRSEEGNHTLWIWPSGLSGSLAQSLSILFVLFSLVCVLFFVSWVLKGGDDDGSGGDTSNTKEEEEEVCLPASLVLVADRKGNLH